MPPKSEPESFVQRIGALPKGPGVSLDAALKPSLDHEAELRSLFATDRANPRLRDPYAGLIDLFNAPGAVRATRARVVADEQDLSAKYVMPLPNKRRRAEGAPATVADLDEFKKNWAIFTEGSLSQLADWSNVVVAGGSVLACVSPLPDHVKKSKRAVRKYFHSEAYPSSDIDLFLYGLTPEQAEKKINAIYEAISDTVPWEVTCIRTKHTVSIHCQYPYRPIQIVLRLYQSPAEILAGFDVDAPCIAFDGDRVWASPRAVVSLMNQSNTIDVTRRSPSYEVRLAKYAARGFEIHVPTLRRHDIDPTIYERSMARITGLARLLALETFSSKISRMNFLSSRRELRGRPWIASPPLRGHRTYRNDLKGDASFGGLETNDYDIATLHIPYGPGWTARRIEKLIYTNDLKMNSTFNPKNKDRRLHRHPAFFGTSEECLEDCCGECPEPETEQDRALQESEGDKYLHGRISFIQENPGRQSISGSFNPIDAGEWSEEAYVTETTKFFSAVSRNDTETLNNMIEKKAGINCRDYVGRTPLHVAILSGAVEAAVILIDAGARMTARLADGRAALHLAAGLGQTSTVRKILERSALNAEQAKLAAEKGEGETVSESGGEESRQTSEPGLFADAVDLGAPEEDEEDTPDVVDLNVADWDLAFTPLAYAILSGSVSTTEEMLAAGADPKEILRSGRTRRPALLPLSLTRFIADDSAACDMARLLIKNGVSSSALTTPESGGTVFHQTVSAKRVKLVETLLQCDPNARIALNFPRITSPWGGIACSPLATSVDANDPAMATLLLAHGARLSTTEEDINQVNEISGSSSYRTISACRPLHIAVAQWDNFAELLLLLDGSLDGNVAAPGLKEQTLLDWVRDARALQEGQEAGSAKTLAVDTSSTGWSRRLAELEVELHKSVEAQKAKAQDQHKFNINVTNKARSEYFARLEDILTSQGAKTWAELNSLPVVEPATASAGMKSQPDPGYRWLGAPHQAPPSYQHALFDALYEACFAGDQAKILQLCMRTKGKNQSPLQIATTRLHECVRGNN
ncbi:hypothetical protein HYDPIDRAFT_153095 [Hydnomerulius pinastri MD-312]|uniref:Ankyrin n=1 Tax=Hydnomerulius pinastri MD-312 TaxID=994086 RepID=A0A0C9WFU6_9AGAM|nr:hypothetical protein HYDPIDRAFT_153095 [Hydnomerulius pinastri MD-312]